MKTENTKVVPAEIDGIPPQVATEMLLEPRAKMTNRMRKNCMASRCKVYPSIAPIQRVQGFDPLTGKDGVEFHYAPDSLIAYDVKFAKRVKNLKWAQLHDHLDRFTKRRARIQRNYLKMMEDPRVSPKDKERLGQVLTAAATQVEAMQDALETEIQGRAAAQSALTLKKLRRAA